MQVGLTAPLDGNETYDRATISNQVVADGQTIDLPDTEVGINDAQVDKGVTVSPKTIMMR